MANKNLSVTYYQTPKEVFCSLGLEKPKLHVLSKKAKIRDVKGLMLWLIKIRSAADTF